MKKLIYAGLIGLFAYVSASRTTAKVKINQEGYLNNATNSSAHYKVIDYNFGVKNDSLIQPWMNKMPTVKPPTAAVNETKPTPGAAMAKKK